MLADVLQTVLFLSGPLTQSGNKSAVAPATSKACATVLVRTILLIYNRMAVGEVRLVGSLYFLSPSAMLYSPRAS